MVLVVISIISLAWLPNQLAGTQFCFRLRTEPGRVFIVSVVVISLNHVGLLIQSYMFLKKEGRTGQVRSSRTGLEVRRKKNSRSIVSESQRWPGQVPVIFLVRFFSRRYLSICPNICLEEIYPEESCPLSPFGLRENVSQPTLCLRWDSNSQSPNLMS